MLQDITDPMIKKTYIVYCHSLHLIITKFGVEGFLLKWIKPLLTKPVLTVVFIKINQFQKAVGC